MDKLRIASVNARGLRNKCKRLSLFFSLKKERIDIIGLQEAHITKNDIEEWKKQWGGPVFFKEGTNRSRGEVFLISKHFNGEVRQLFSQSILTVSVKNDKYNLIIANIYSPNNTTEKKDYFYSLVEDLMEYNDKELVVIGDFNCTLNSDLDIISGHPHDKSESDAFMHLIEQLGLIDMWRLYHPCEKDATWMRFNPYTARRLDYCFVSENALQFCSSCNHLNIHNTDHKAVILELIDSDFIRGPGYWRFNNSYLKNDKFVKSMNDMLHNFVQLNGDLNSIEKWELCKVEIRNFCIDFGKNLSCQTRNEQATLSQQLASLESQLANNPQNENIKIEYLKVKQKLEILQVHRARGAQIRARLKWIEEGEKNSKFFCNLEKARNKNKIITRIIKDSGNIITDQREVLEEQVNFYNSLYNQETTVANVKSAASEFIKHETFRTLDEIEANTCEGMVTLEETTNALREMRNGSAPGSDGLTIEFIKYFWSIIGTTVTNSFNDSFLSGNLSFSQSQGVITLIHKGNNLDRDRLNNWRPITLTNSDYKIIAKTLAIRLGNVIHLLINEDQVGYIKGRNITTVLRSIDDVVNYLNETGRAGYILALDFSKAFDSISKTYLLHVFKLFGFGADFQKWVNVLTGNNESSINHGGWLSHTFKVNCGIRQGCPFSPLAFVLAVELLAIKIRNSEIQGITVPSAINTENTTIKIKQLADDTTLFLNNKEDMIRSCDILKTFESFTGLKLNKDKTKALKMGRYTEQNLPFLLVDNIKILGIYFQRDKMAMCIEENWKGRIENIQKMIKDWSKRDLSIHGKIVVTKTFLISQLIFVMQSVGLPETVLNKVNTILYKFIWQKVHSNKKAFEKVKRTVMEADYHEGGLKMINLVTMQKCMYLQWVGRLYNESEGNWSAIPRWHLNKILCNEGVFRINCKAKDLTALEHLNNDFWKVAISTYLDNKKLEKMEDINHNNMLNQLILYNDLIRYKGKVLCFKQWKHKGIQFMRDVVHVSENRLLNQKELEILLGYKSGSTIFELNALKNAIPPSWIGWITNKEVQSTVASIACDALLSNTKPKEINRIIKDRCANNISSYGENFWRRKLNFDFSKEVWLTPRSCTQEIRLLELQWKINHNLYPTNILLQKMKVTDTNKCDTCVDEVDYIEHFFFTCPLVNAYWSRIGTLISAKMGIPLKLSLIEVIFGIQNNALSKQNKLMVNHIILIGKMCVSIARKTKNMSALQIIFDFHMLLRMKHFS